MKILILGEEGFVGKSLKKSFIEDGLHKVSGVSKQTGTNLLSYNSTLNALEEYDPDLVINCAAHVGSVHYGMERPATIFHENMMMVLNIFKAIKDFNPSIKMVNLISNCVYPANAEIQSESEMWEGSPHFSALPYASTRRMILIMADSYHNENNINSKNLVLPGIFGPGNHTDIERVHALDGMIIRMLKAKKEDLDEFEIWGTGKPIREWCYIDDLVKVIKTSIDLDFSNEAVNLANSKGYSILETAEITKEVINYKGALKLNTEFEDGAAIKILDDSKFKRIFGEFKFTDFSEAISKTAEYHKSLI
jgi:GDP-L-fucose synthase